MLGGERGAVGNGDLAGEEAPGAQHEVVTHLLGSRSYCLWPRQKGLPGYVFSCLHRVSLEISCLFRKPQGKRFQSTLVLCFFCCSAYLEALPTVCTEQCPFGHKHTPDPWLWVKTETYPPKVGPPCPKTSHLVRARVGYKYPGSWLQVSE